VRQTLGVGTFGNAAKTVIRGPGVNHWDVSFFKNFPVKEKVRPSVSRAFYNFFNKTPKAAADSVGVTADVLALLVAEGLGRIDGERAAGGAERCGESDGENRDGDSGDDAGVEEIASGGFFDGDAEGNS